MDNQKQPKQEEQTEQPINPDFDKLEELAKQINDTAAFQEFLNKLN